MVTEVNTGGAGVTASVAVAVMLVCHIVAVMETVPDFWNTVTTPEVCDTATTLAIVSSLDAHVTE